MPERIRVLIIEDHPLLRQALRAVLTAAGSDLEVVAEASDGVTGLELAAAHVPDVVLVDLVLPGMSGHDVLRELRETLPETRAIALSAHEDEQSRERALAAGAATYVRKSRSPAEILDAIRQVAASLARTPSRFAFDARTREILDRYAEGYPLKEIAQRVGLSVPEVDACRRDLMRRLGLSSRSDVARLMTKGPAPSALAPPL